MPRYLWNGRITASVRKLSLDLALGLFDDIIIMSLKFHNKYNLTIICMNAK